jgi:hypothetical protein
VLGGKDGHAPAVWRPCRTGGGPRVLKRSDRRGRRGGPGAGWRRHPRRRRRAVKGIRGNVCGKPGRGPEGLAGCPALVARGDAALPRAARPRGSIPAARGSPHLGGKGGLGGGRP